MTLGMPRLAYAYNGNVAVADARLGERSFIERVNDKGVFGVFAYLAHLFLVVVKRYQLGARARKLGGKSGSEAPEPHYTVYGLVL